MLSRTAENLFWMARDMERAENTARMLDVSFRMALLPSALDKQALPGFGAGERELAGEDHQGIRRPRGRQAGQRGQAEGQYSSIHGTNLRRAA